MHVARRFRTAVGGRRFFGLGHRLFDLDGHRFDRRYGVNAGGAEELASLTVRVGDPKEGHRNGATPPRLARWWLNELSGDLSQFTFIDMGSGKGRVLILAAERGFRRVMGVEFAEELHEAALVNAEAVRRRGLEIEPVLGDAAGFEFPLEPLIVHFNNPFSERVMHQVIDNISRSYNAVRRPIGIVYQQLINEDPSDRTNNIELLTRVPFLSSRELAKRGWVDRALLAPHTGWIFETQELQLLQA
jgi:SAM-dependent methyltransferase